MHKPDLMLKLRAHGVFFRSSASMMRAKRLYKLQALADRSLEIARENYYTPD